MLRLSCCLLNSVFGLCSAFFLFHGTESPTLNLVREFLSFSLTMQRNEIESIYSQNRKNVKRFNSSSLATPTHQISILITRNSWKLCKRYFWWILISWVRNHPSSLFLMCLRFDGPGKSCHASHQNSFVWISSFARVPGQWMFCDELMQESLVWFWCPSLSTGFSWGRSSETLHFHEVYSPVFKDNPALWIHTCAVVLRYLSECILAITLGSTEIEKGDGFQARNESCLMASSQLEKFIDVASPTPTKRKQPDIPHLLSYRRKPEISRQILTYIACQWKVTMRVSHQRVVHR
jgi:hypothetical protein